MLLVQVLQARQYSGTMVLVLEYHGTSMGTGYYSVLKYT